MDDKHSAGEALWLLAAECDVYLEATLERAPDTDSKAHAVYRLCKIVSVSGGARRYGRPYSNERDRGVLELRPPGEANAVILQSGDSCT